MLTASARWLTLVALNAIALGVLGFYSTSGAAPQGGGQPPFNNAVEQRDGMVRELREIKELLKEQNALLRAGSSKPADPAKRSAPAAGRPSGRGLTLIELLITLVVVSIVAAMLIPQLGRQIPDQLSAVAEIVAADLEYARSLAVVNNSKYSVSFDLPGNRYVLRHSGTNTLLHLLPASPFRQNDDSPDEQTTDLADLPIAHPEVRIVQIANGGGAVTSVSDVEFNSLGGTTRTSVTTVWLACGVGSEARYAPVQINPVTGLVEVGEISKGLPTQVAALVAASADLVAASPD